MSDLPVVVFPVKNLDLTKSEQKVVEKLVEAAKSIASIYQKQENQKFPGANFYPHDAAVEEILAAAKSEPEILSPYTIVERNRSGKLVSIPYHIKFKKDLGKTSALLRVAAKITENKEFSRRYTSKPMP